ncbi:MAG: hypothetical protein NVSMB1_17470 [Polyangiales bacterium]
MLWLLALAIVAAYFIGPLTFQVVAILSLVTIVFVAAGLGVGVRAMEEKSLG